MSWGWPGTAAQVHSSFNYADSDVGWGWPGTAAQVHSSSLCPM